MTVSIVIVDDHLILRQGIRLLIQSDPNLELVGEAGDGQEALELVKSLKPEILELDLMMPGMNR